MPTISMFFGILIRMYFSDTDKHKMPHFHAFYAGSEAVFSLEGELIAGSFPGKQAAFVRAWALLHNEELIADWALAVNDEEVFRIDPLR